MFLVPDAAHLTTTASAVLRLTLTAAAAAQLRGAGVEFEFLVLSYLCSFTLFLFGVFLVCFFFFFFNYLFRLRRCWFDRLTETIYTYAYLSSWLIQIVICLYARGVILRCTSISLLLRQLVLHVKLKLVFVREFGTFFAFQIHICKA